MIDFHLPLLRTSEAILVLSEDLKIVFPNPAALRMMRAQGRNPNGALLLELLDDRSKSAAFNIESSLRLHGHWSGDTWLGRANAAALPVRLVIDRYRDASNLRHVCVLSDISQRKQTEERLTQLSQHDSLTGLINRAHFVQELDTRLYNEELPYALLFVDVDDLKKINDTLGHHIGDLCLCKVASRLVQAVRLHLHADEPVMASAPLVARIGGDEFVILVPIYQGDEAVRIATRVSDLMKAPWYPDTQHALVISTSIGIAYAPFHGSTSKKLLELADQAMYRAKTSRKGSVHELLHHLPPPTPPRFGAGFDFSPSDE